jgi:hypothetical protein
MPEKPQNMTSKFRGVSFNSQLKKWKAVITVGRSQHFLGYFPDELEVRVPTPRSRARAHAGTGCACIRQRLATL